MRLCRAARVRGIRTARGQDSGHPSRTALFKPDGSVRLHYDHYSRHDRLDGDILFLPLREIPTPVLKRLFTVFLKPNHLSSPQLSFCAHSYVGAAVLMLPATITFPLAAGLTGHIIGRTLKYKALNILAFTLLVGALGGFTALRESSPVGLQIALLLIGGTSCGIPFISKVFMVQAAVAESDVFMATAIVATATSIGECFGVAVASTAFQNRWNTLLERELGHTALVVVISSRDAERSAEKIARLDKTTAGIYQHIAMASFETVWIVMAALAGVALVLVLWSKDITLKAPPTRLIDGASSSDNPKA